jgi:hypothetical protein
MIKSTKVIKLDAGGLSGSSFSYRFLKLQQKSVLRADRFQQAGDEVCSAKTSAGSSNDLVQPIFVM